MLAGINMARYIEGKPLITLPEETMLGALMKYITDKAHLAEKNSLQPINSNWALVPPIELPKKERKNKKLKNDMLAKRSIMVLETCCANIEHERFDKKELLSFVNNHV